MRPKGPEPVRERVPEDRVDSIAVFAKGSELAGLPRPVKSPSAESG
jgi:hypothetical protein